MLPLPLEMYIPPPSPPAAEFPWKVQFLTVGVLSLTYIPPPLRCPDSVPVPPVIVKPSRMVSVPSPLAQVTTLVSRPVASMVVTAAPPELRNVTALPAKSMASL